MNLEGRLSRLERRLEPTDVRPQRVALLAEPDQHPDDATRQRYTRARVAAEAEFDFVIVLVPLRAIPTEAHGWTRRTGGTP